MKSSLRAMVVAYLILAQTAMATDPWKIISGIGKGAEKVAGDIGKGAEKVAGDIGKGAEKVVGDIGKEAEKVVGDIGKGAEGVIRDIDRASRDAERWLRQAGRDIDAATRFAGRYALYSLEQHKDVIDDTVTAYRSWARTNARNAARLALAIHRQDTEAAARLVGEMVLYNSHFRDLIRDIQRGKAFHSIVFMVAAEGDLGVGLGYGVGVAVDIDSLVYFVNNRGRGFPRNKINAVVFGNLGVSLGASAGANATLFVGLDRSPPPEMRGPSIDVSVQLAVKGGLSVAAGFNATTAPPQFSGFVAGPTAGLKVEASGGLSMTHIFTRYTTQSSAAKPRPWNGSPSRPTVQRPTYKPRPAIQRPSYRPRPAIQRPTYKPRPAVQRPTYKPRPAVQRPTHKPRPAVQRPTYKPRPAYRSSHPVVRQLLPVR